MVPCYSFCRPSSTNFAVLISYRCLFLNCPPTWKRQAGPRQCRIAALQSTYIHNTYVLFTTVKKPWCSRFRNFTPTKWHFFENYPKQKYLVDDLWRIYLAIYFLCIFYIIYQKYFSFLTLWICIAETWWRKGGKRLFWSIEFLGKFFIL